MGDARRNLTQGYQAIHPQNLFLHFVNVRQIPKNDNLPNFATMNIQVIIDGKTRWNVHPILSSDRSLPPCINVTGVVEGNPDEVSFCFVFF